jgi:succinate dehydrogenase/fumarate reductase flavoprotein subunit
MFSHVDIETDVLVIGGGMAGLFAAIKAREEGVDVVLVDKNYVSRSGSTAFAEGDYSVCSPAWGHDAKAWQAQVALSGEYLNDPEWTEITIRESLNRYNDLRAWGIKPKEYPDGSVLRFGRPAGFGPLQCCFLGRGWTFLPTMRRQAEKVGVCIIDRTMITDLLIRDGAAVGAVGFQVRTGDLHTFSAKAIVMSTGNGTFRNVPGAMGPVGFLSYDGESMAYRCGARIGGKEFANTGAGGFRAPKNEETRIDLEGKAPSMIPAHYPGWVSYGPAISFTNSYVDAEGYETNRMVAANTVHEGRGPIYWNLDGARPEDLEATIRDIRDSKTEFRLERVGIDLAKGGLYAGVLRLESAPGHSVFGGGAGISSAGTDCTTDIPGLFGAGDVYQSKAVGASYPAFGFGLRNASVTGARAGRAAARFASGTGRVSPDVEQLPALREAIYAPLNRVGGFSPAWVEQQLYNLVMPYYILLVKHGERLNAALTMVRFLKSHAAPRMTARDVHELRLAHETRNRLLTMEMILASAAFRTESRGGHYREDYPGRDERNWFADVMIKEGDAGMEIFKKPLPREWLPNQALSYEDRYPRRFPGENSRNGRETK